MARNVLLSLALMCCAAIALAAAPNADKPADPKAAVRIDAAWPVYRGGPNMQGVAKGKLTDKPVLLWKYKTDRDIKSSPIIAEGKVFIGSNDGHIHAIDFKAGKPAWKYRVGPPPKKEDEHHVPEPIEAPPLYVDGMVITGAGDGFVYALNAKNGELVWKYETEAEILGSANWAWAPDRKSKRILVGSYDNFLHCIDARTGKKIWDYETDNYINGAPAIDRGGVVFGGCDGFIHVVDVNKGRKVASIEVEAYIAGTVALAEGRAYTGNMGDSFTCIDLNAKEQVWDYKHKNFPYFSSAAIYGKYVIFGGRDRRLHCVNRDTGATIWQLKTRGKVDSSPVVCDDKVVVGSEDGRVYMVGLEKGGKIWEYEIGKPVMSSPAIVDGVIVIASEDGFVYAFGDKK